MEAGVFFEPEKDFKKRKCQPKKKKDRMKQKTNTVKSVRISLKTRIDFKTYFKILCGPLKSAAKWENRGKQICVKYFI